MDQFVSKLQNFWFYYKKHLLVALAVLLVAAYLTIQDASAPKPDYHIGLVWAVNCTDEELAALKDIFTTAGRDINGDGQVLVQIHTYYVDLSTGSDADVVQALDADLIGGMSGIFLLEDAATFRRVTDGLVSEPLTVLENGLSLTVRKDAAETYLALAEKLS